MLLEQHDTWNGESHLYVGMSLRTGNTKWVLFLASSGESETRHISDLAFGLHCLESTGIKQADIFIYVDGKDRLLISQFIGTGTKSVYTVKVSDDFFVDLTNNTHENLVMFVTGHGDIHGIDAPKPISPYSLLSCVKSAPNLVQAVLYLGQCHAGIFNYIGAGRNAMAPGAQGPNVIVIGATSLHESVSTSTQEQLGPNPLSWVANLFLLHVFKWISTPVDVDGDGKCTVIDSYKYAGVMANRTSKELKMGSFVKSFELHSKWLTATQLHNVQQTLASEIALKAATYQLVNELNVHYTHQEGWILNAIPAQTLEY